jgi:hypothetical protein
LLFDSGLYRVMTAGRAALMMRGVLYSRIIAICLLSIIYVGQMEENELAIIANPKRLLVFFSVLLL